jgi:hypothetical protein
MKAKAVVEVKPAPELEGEEKVAVEKEIEEKEKEDEGKEEEDDQAKVTYGDYGDINIDFSGDHDEL